MNLRGHNNGKVTHGLSASSEHGIWSKMKARCLNINDPSYENYGARGIVVCDRWLNSFENFYKDMGPRPSKNHSIDRINNDGNYEPSNCRWATKKQQIDNRRTSILIEFKNQTKSLKDWCLEYNIDYKLAHRRYIVDNWTIEKTLSKKEKLISNFCPKGHEYTIENTKIRFHKNRNERNCLTCRNLQQRQAYKRKKNVNR